MSGDLYIALIAAESAIAGVLVSSFVSLLVARSQRQHERRQLLRAKYEEMALSFTESLAWLGEINSLRKKDDLFRFSYSPDARKASSSRSIFQRSRKSVRHLKDMVKRGAYANREAALQRLGGFFQDMKHVSIYAPYCDAFAMDQAMAALVADPRIALGGCYGVKVFS